LETLKSKSDHPIFLALSEPGTGKSRLLDELPYIACNMFESNEELGRRIRGEDIFVFK